MWSECILIGEMEFKDFVVANRLGFSDSVFRISSSFILSGERQRRYVADASVVLKTFAIYLQQNNLILVFAGTN